MTFRGGWILAMVIGAAVATIDLGPAQAQTGPIYPWCLEYGELGMTNCYFSTWEQCQAAGRGNGGLCYENPFYTAPAPAAPQSSAPAKRRSKR